MLKFHVALTVLLLLGLGRASGQDDAKLKARLERLEAENVAMRKELAELKKELAAFRGSSAPLVEEAKVKKAVADFLDDLNKGRMGSAYHGMSPAYQKDKDRQAFDLWIGKKRGLQNVAWRITVTGNRTPEYKVRKLSKDRTYECDFVAPAMEGVPRFNMTVRLIEHEGEWKIDEFLELTSVAADTGVREVIQGFFEDLHKGRLGSAYHGMSVAYQKRTDRKLFDEFLEKTPTLKAIDMQTRVLDLYVPEFKIRKVGKDNAYECDILVAEQKTRHPILITLRLVEQDGEWKIDDFVEIQEMIKKKG